MFGGNLSQHRKCLYTGHEVSMLPTLILNSRVIADLKKLPNTNDINQNAYSDPMLSRDTTLYLNGARYCYMGFAACFQKKQIDAGGGLPDYD